MEKSQLATIISSLPHHDLPYDLHVHWYPPSEFSFKDLSWQKEYYVYTRRVALCYDFRCPQCTGCSPLFRLVEDVIEPLIPSLEISPSL